jgi:predicted dehydrogenase
MGFQDRLSISSWKGRFEMSDQKLRVGVIGLGWYAITSHLVKLRATGRAEVVAASRRDQHALELAAQELSIPQTFTDWREMLDKADLDAVIITTPHNAHREPAVAAIERGLHVLIEKPLATTIEDACAILDAARKSRRVVAMGVNRRTDPSWRTVRHTVASGEIGELRQISAVVSADLRVFRETMRLEPSFQGYIDSSEMLKAFAVHVVGAGNWRSDPLQVGGDMFADTGSHLVDAMLWIAGAPAVEVLAYHPKGAPPQASILTMQALLSNDVILSVTFNDHVTMGDTFTFAGEGMLYVLGDRGRISASVGWGSGPAENLVIERNGDRQGLAVEGQPVAPAAAFVSSILDGAPVAATVEDAARVVALIEATNRSAAQRQVVKVDPVS